MKSLTPNGNKTEIDPLMSPEEHVTKGSGSSSTTPTLSSAARPNKQPDLKRALEEANARDATAKAALARSDAVILELRTSVRSLKKQLEQVQQEREQGDALHAKLKQELRHLEEDAHYHLQEEQEDHERNVQELKSRLAQSETQAHSTVVGELQVQLDRAHAQILTSDMVRQELEDTLEAEQYTWELRVQDQERIIQSLQGECRTLREDLEHCRLQWKEAEEGWTTEVQELQSQLQTTTTRSIPGKKGNDDSELQERIDVLEREREELQSCLDEAMQELEAVDQELRTSPTSGVEPLQHLYKWLLERNDETVEKMPDSVDTLVDEIQLHIESIPSANLISNTDAALQLAELEAQISVYRGDLKARDESNAELRGSLKEAVALLKPLQDAVAKSELEKQQLEKEIQKLSGRDDTMEQLHQREEQVQQLERELADLKQELVQVKAASSPERTSRGLQASGEDGTEGNKQFEAVQSPPRGQAKRDSERALQDMLKSAQGRFQALHQQNHDIESDNVRLRHRVQELEQQLRGLNQEHDEIVRRNIAAELRDAAVDQLEQDVKGYRLELKRKEDEVIRLEEELDLAKDLLSKHDLKMKETREELERLKEVAERVEELEAEVLSTKGDLEAKKEAELVLTKGLKQALGLLRPLETHLETAEQEKRDLAKQLKACKKHIAKLEAADSESRALSLPNEVEMHGDKKRGLEASVKKLEEENNRLQNALEEVSHNLSFGGDENTKSQVRLKEHLVELNSRYEVTQDKLERAVVENHALIDALKHKESDERKIMAEVKQLRADLKKSRLELENAKYIATSALIKVEELTMANVEQLSMLRDDSTTRNGRSHSDLPSPQRRAMLQRVRTLEQEVDYASKVNGSLVEGSLEDRERIVQALMAASHSTEYTDEQHSSDPPEHGDNNFGQHRGLSGGHYFDDDDYV